MSRVTLVGRRGERLTTENYVENLGNFIVSCLNSFQLLAGIRSVDLYSVFMNLCVYQVLKLL